MKVTYQDGMAVPSVIGRDNGKRKYWRCKLTCKYENATESEEYTPLDKLTAFELQSVIHQLARTLFERHGDALHTKFEAESK